MDLAAGSATDPSIPDGCLNHPYTATRFGCSRCGRRFCGNCLVSLQGKWLCGFCKTQHVGELTYGRQYLDRAGTEALGFALAWLFCSGVLCLGAVLEPIALFRAVGALRRYRGDAAWPDRWKAITALTIAVPLTLLHVAGLAAVLGMLIYAAFTGAR